MVAKFKTNAERRDHVIEFFRDHRDLQQFGQDLDTCKLTHGGTAGCLVCCVQNLVWLWTGKHVTMDQVCRAGGFPANKAQRNGQAGMLSSQAIRALAFFGVHYKIVRGMSWSDLEKKSMSHGPVIFFEHYGWHPEWKDYHYRGVKANGEPNGYAEPEGKAGKNQLSGFNGSHACILGGYYLHDDDTVTDIIKDVNHGSPARPEKPAFDKYSRKQAGAAYYKWSKLAGPDKPASDSDKTYAFIPLKVLQP